MNLDNIPADRDGLQQLIAYIYENKGTLHSIDRLLSFSHEFERPDFHFRGGHSTMLSSRITRETIDIQPMPVEDYAAILHIVAKGIRSEREGYLEVVEYVEVDKSEALYASLVREQKDRHDAILKAVDALLGSEIPSDQAEAIRMISEWREGLPEKEHDAFLTEDEPRFRTKLDLEL